MTALQPPLGTMPKSFQPMLDRRGVRNEIARHFDHGEEDVALEHFEWAFDISVLGAAGGRAEVIVFAPCVEQHIKKLYNPKWCVRSYQFDTVLRTMLPGGVRDHGGRTVTCPLLMKAWGACSRMLVIDLIDAGHLKQFGASEYRPGRGGEAIIEIASVEKFLLSRRLNA